MVKHQVMIMRCPEYNPSRISMLIEEGMKTLGARPTGNILLKPNAVIAHPSLFPHAFTRKEFLDGAIVATKRLATNAKEITVGERSGITIPTRFCFRNAGYPEVIKKHGVKAHYFDETRQVPVKLTRKENLRSQIHVPEPITTCDFLINLPKFKAHPWTRLTLSLKNFIGIQDDRYRLVDHNGFLEQKIADLQEVIQPGFIAVDAIEAGQKMMLTPTPFCLGAIVMGVNSCAVDAVCCHMVHVNPQDLIHLRLASERGFGPMNLEEIDVLGDFPLEEVRKKTRNFEFCMQPIDAYFGSAGPMRCTVGKFPEKHSPDYCWGGCPGALQEAIHILRAFNPDLDQRMKKIRYVVGKVEGSLQLEEGEQVIFAGDCTSWEGRMDGQKVDIGSTYVPHGMEDGAKPRSSDMLVKLLRSMLLCLGKGSSRYLHQTGCPVSVAEHVNVLSFVGGIRNPHFDLRLALPLVMNYGQMRLFRFLNRLHAA